MGDHPNAALFRELAGALESSDLERYAEFLADDVEWWQIGSAEPIRGKAALLASMQGVLGEVKFDIDLHDVLANDDHLVALVTATAMRGGETFTYRTAEIYHVADGKVTQRWAFSDDTEAINRFFA